MNAATEKRGRVLSGPKKTARLLRNAKVAGGQGLCDHPEGAARAAVVTERDARLASSYWGILESAGDRRARATSSEKLSSRRSRHMVPVIIHCRNSVGVRFLTGNSGGVTVTK